MQLFGPKESRYRSHLTRRAFAWLTVLSHPACLLVRPAWTVKLCSGLLRRRTSSKATILYIGLKRSVVISASIVSGWSCASPMLAQRGKFALFVTEPSNHPFNTDAPQAACGLTKRWATLRLS